MTTVEKLKRVIASVLDEHLLNVIHNEGTPVHDENFAYRETIGLLEQAHGDYIKENWYTVKWKELEE